MNFLYNMKIGTRLALGFASACLITIGIAIYGIYMMGQMSDTMAKMYKHPMTVATQHQRGGRRCGAHAPRHERRGIVPDA